MSATPQTVSLLSILFMAATLFICFGMPIGLAIWGKVKYKKAFSFLPMLLGIAGFTLFQGVLRLNVMLPLIQSAPWFKTAISQVWVQWLYAAFLCITAGLFEEPVRFLAFTLLKKKRQYPDGLSYGIGHGGIEAILIVGISFINNILFSLAINSGSWNTIVAVVPQTMQAQYEQVRNTLISLPPDMFLMGGAERVFTIAIQIAFSLIVVKGFTTNRKWLYLFIATVLHILVDFIAVSLQMLKVSPWIIEGVIFVEAVAAVLYIIQQAKQWRKGLTISTEEVLNAEQGQTDHP